MGNTPSQQQSTSPQQPCPTLTVLQKEIAKIEKKGKEQEVSDAKIQLSEVAKINGEVEQIEAKYAKEYNSLVIAEEQSKEYVEWRKEQINKKISGPEKAIIDEIVDCATQQIEYLESEWKKTRERLPELQRALAQAQIDLAEAEEPYTQIKNYKTNQNDLDALKTLSAKEIEAQNFRSAYFLVEQEMEPGLGKPATPSGFNLELEAAALAYYQALDGARKAKAELDQATADSQKKRKAYEEAKAKRRENILKRIAEASFPTEDGDDSGEDDSDSCPSDSSNI